jgi:superfamily I DNA/RNA helicase
MNLSQEQQAAAYTDSRQALCLAGAGSGKTRVLISRIQHLIEDCHVSPYEILTCTFTRKAGGEMTERLEKAIGNQAHSVTIGTLHSVALHMIQRFGEFIGLNPGKITVYGPWEESVLLRDVCVELGYHTGKKFKGTTKKDVQAAFDLFYTRGKRDERNYIPHEIMNAFFLRCRENNALTYGMIMTSFLELIPRIGRMLNYRHILVDEVQDLDPLQWRIVNLLKSVCNASLFVVGDDSQSIYGFRGADPDYLIRNQDKFDIYKLRDNYRSDRFIVEAANNLIRHNKNRLDLEMWAKRGWGESIQVLKDMDSSQITGSLFTHTIFDGNIAVLARNHFLLEKLSGLLSDAGIDHDYIGKTTAFTRSENFRKVHAFLNLAVNPFDNFSFMICKDYLGISRDDYKAIRMHAVKNNMSHFQVFSEMVYQDFNEQFLIDFVEAAKIHSIIDLFKILEHIDFGFDQGPILQFIADYLNVQRQPNIEDYLEWLALFDVQDEISTEPKKLQLMTIHASKGLEFSMVVIAGLNEGILPSYRESELESERRLAYVAITRAKDFLILTSRPVDPEAKIPQPPSRFIKEAL